MNDCIALSSMFNKFTFSSRKKLLRTLDSFEDVIGVLQISEDTTGVVAEERLPTVLNEVKSRSDFALIQRDPFPTGYLISNFPSTVKRDNLVSARMCVMSEFLNSQFIYSKMELEPDFFLLLRIDMMASNVFTHKDNV